MTLGAISASRASIWPWKYGAAGWAARQKPQMMKISTAATAISAATGRRLACFGTSGLGLEGGGVGTGVFMERLL